MFVSTSKLYFTEPDANAPSAPEVPDEPWPNVTEEYPFCSSGQTTFIWLLLINWTDSGTITL